MTYINLNKLKEKEVVPGFKGKFVHSENLTIAHWTISAGSSLPDHKHVHEQIVNLISGTFEFNLNGFRSIIEAGSIVIVPSDVLHSGKAITDCYIIDVFYPIREDYK
ncbi:MAG: cupin domain-containing protein [Candidatus Heimdallarchaeota archaeon]|nr:cupin domain-containing protein [Candidatus Heimdallarchaeota archaeon]